MSLKERLKNSPYLNNWKYPVVYFAISIAVIVPFPVLLHIDVLRIFNIYYMTAAPFAFLLYFVWIAGDMLSVNFVIKNHRHTPLLFSFIVVMIGLMLFAVRAFVWQNMELSIVYLCAILFIVAVIYHIAKYRNTASNLISLGSVVFLFAVLQYCIVAMLLLNYWGIALVVLAAGVLFGGILFVFGMLKRKKHIPPETTLAALEVRFEQYLNKVFKGLPMSEDLIALREQLKLALTSFADESLIPGIGENQLYGYALDSLGDYSPLIYPHRKNIFARLADTTNRVANILVGATLQLGLTFAYTIYLGTGDWVTSTINELSATAPIVLLTILVFLVLLITSRTVRNFMQKRHFTTPLCVGIIILLLVAITVTLALAPTNSLLFDIFAVRTLLLIIVGGVAAVTLAAQTILFLLKRNKFPK